jgi:hypothetical protein
VPTYDQFRSDPYYSAYGYPRGPFRMSSPAGVLPHPGPAVEPWNDAEDLMAEAEEEYIHQCLDRIEHSQRDHQMAIAAQQQVLAEMKRAAILEMVQKLAAEGFAVDPKIDVPDLAREPTPQAQAKKLEFMRKTRAWTAPKPTSPNVGLRPYRFGRGTSSVVADPKLSQTTPEPSYADILAEVRKTRGGGVERPKLMR